LQIGLAGDQQDRPGTAGGGLAGGDERDAGKMRGERPFVFSNLKSGQGLSDIIAIIEEKGMLKL
jgi:hypothetical protein